MLKRLEVYGQTVCELPALQADTLARRVLKRHGFDPDGGVLSLTFDALDVPEVRADPDLLHFMPAFDFAALPSFQAVWELQTSVLLMYSAFILERPPLEWPVRMQADAILRPDALRVSFCSPPLALVLSRRLATYAELSRDLSTEAVYNLAELLSVEAINDYVNRNHGQ